MIAMSRYAEETPVNLCRTIVLYALLVGVDRNLAKIDGSTLSDFFWNNHQFFCHGKAPLQVKVHYPR